MRRVGSDRSDAADGAGARDEWRGEGVFALAGENFTHVGDDTGEDDADEGAAGGDGGEGALFDGERGGGGGNDEGGVCLREMGGGGDGWSGHDVWWLVFLLG